MLKQFLTSIVYVIIFLLHLLYFLIIGLNFHHFKLLELFLQFFCELHEFISLLSDLFFCVSDCLGFLFAELLHLQNLVFGLIDLLEPEHFSLKIFIPHELRLALIVLNFDVGDVLAAIAQFYYFLGAIFELIFEKGGFVR